MSEKITLSSEIIEPGSVIAERYEIKRLIGPGGMGSVYLALDRQKEGEQIALKLLHREFVEDRTFVKRFIREVQLMSKVDHPNVVKAYEIGAEEGRIYYAMEYIPSFSLEKMMDLCSFDSRQVAHLIVEICKGLRAIHENGIMHRDLKPANILIRGDGTIKIADFGVAREKQSRLTSKTEKVGSICYMAPEIWLGKKLTPAIDFYSLGILLYELATGDVPFDHEWPGELMAMHLEKRVAPPADVNSRVPGWLNQLIMRMLGKTPKERPKSAEEIITYVRLYALNDDDPYGGDGSDRESLQPEKEKFMRFELPALDAMNSAKIKELEQERGQTYLFKLTATRLIDQADLEAETYKKRRKATVSIPLPRRAAAVIEIETPSRDFLYLGLFLISLQVLDGIFTSLGVERFGVHAEGNPLLRFFMEYLGPHQTVVMAKLLAILMVVFLTIAAKRMSWVKDIVSVLSCFYLFAAIIPWVTVLWMKFFP